MKDIKPYKHTWRFVFLLSKTYPIPYDPQLLSWYCKWTAKEVTSIKEHEFHMLFRPNLQIYTSPCVHVNIVHWLKKLMVKLALIIQEQYGIISQCGNEVWRRPRHTMSILGSVPNIQSKLNNNLLKIPYQKKN